MPFSIRDDEIRDLADELQKLTSAKNRSAAIKAALKAQIKLAAKPIPFQSRLEALQNRVASLNGGVLTAGPNQEMANDVS